MKRYAGIIFAALAAATVLGAVSRAGSDIYYVCDGGIRTDARHATETPAGWVVETQRGVVVVANCRRAP